MGCELVARGGLGLCAACAAVYAAAFALYWRLVERDCARMEAGTPGIIEATSRALAEPLTASRASGRPAGLMLRRALEDSGVPIDWQIQRLATFVAELRARAISLEEPA